MLKKCIKSILLTTAIISTSQSFGSKCFKHSEFFPHKSPMASINCDFHLAYDAKVQDIKRTLGAPGGRPIILNLGDKIILQKNNIKAEHKINTKQYHQVKSVGHLLFSIYLLLNNVPSGLVDKKLHTKLTSLRHHAVLAKAELVSHEYKVERAILSQSIQLISETLKNNQVDTRLVNAYIKDTKQWVKQLREHGRAIKLAALSHIITPWLEALTASELKKLGIVVATVHQARAYETSIEYFQKLLNLSFSMGALGETQLVVMENKFDEKSALSLLARHYLDRNAAQALFNDPERLQYDLLAPDLTS